MRKAICDKCGKEMSIRVKPTTITYYENVTDPEKDATFDLCPNCQRRLIAFAKERDPIAG